MRKEKLSDKGAKNQGNLDQNQERNVLKVMLRGWKQPLVQRNQQEANMEAVPWMGRDRGRLTQLSYHLDAGPAAFVLTERDHRQLSACLC